MKKIFQLALCFFVILSLPGISLAFSSIAAVDGYYQSTAYVLSNSKSQKQADHDALEGCRVNARTNGLTNLVRKCAVIARGNSPGYGASTCGDNGCTWVTGQDGQQEAVNAVYNDCLRNYTNCQKNDIRNWDDFAGFPQKASVVSSVAESCRPRTPNITCQSQCVNGDCTVIYTNGCKMRVQVQPHFNPLNNQWEYPAPSC